MSDQKFASMIMKVVEETETNPPPSLISIKSNSEILINLPKRILAQFKKQCPEEVKDVHKYHPINEENFLELESNDDPDFNKALDNYTNCFEKHNRDYLEKEAGYASEMMVLKMSLNKCFGNCFEWIGKKVDNEVESCVRKCVHNSFDDTDVLINNHMKMYSKLFP